MAAMRTCTLSTTPPMPSPCRWTIFVDHYRLQSIVAIPSSHLVRVARADRPGPGILRLLRLWLWLCKSARSALTEKGGLGLAWCGVLSLSLSLSSTGIPASTHPQRTPV